MLEWIPNNELQILRMPLNLMMKIPNRLKTMAAKVFDVLLKENGVKFRNGKFDMCISTCSNSKKRLPRFVIPKKIAPLLKLSQKNCDFLIYVILCLSDTRRCGTQQCRPDKRKINGKKEIVHARPRSPWLKDQHQLGESALTC